MEQSLRTRFSFSEIFSGANVARLALMAVLFTLIDTIQSFYAQRVLNVFTEFNFLPSLFYSHGFLGYLIYAPIECVAIFGTLSMLWLWGSYVLWFHHSIVSGMSIFKHESSIHSIREELSRADES